MKNENKKEIEYELKCIVCKKVCGVITYPAGTKVDLNALYAEHQTLCDEHSPRDKK